MLNKKRKRPKAKDWPPMSKDKKSLQTYPRKLPRLLDAPFLDVWVTMMKHVKIDHRRRWIRAGAFRDLHHELFLTVPRYGKETTGLLRSLKKLDPYHPKGLKIFYVRTERITSQAADLRWVTQSKWSKFECLWWCESSSRDVIQTSSGHVATKGPRLSTARYLKEIDWMSHLDYYYHNGGRWDRQCDYCGGMHTLRSHRHHLKMAVRLAPKGMNRGYAITLAKTMLDIV